MILVWQADDGNPETFDDSDFYQQLLREFLESSDTLGLGGGPLLLSFLFSWWMPRVNKQVFKQEHAVTRMTNKCGSNLGLYYVIIS
jgi:hypothetical protein